MLDWLNLEQGVWSTTPDSFETDNFVFFKCYLKFYEILSFMVR